MTTVKKSQAVIAWATCAVEGLAVWPLVNAHAFPSIDRMCGKYPDTRVVIAQMARIGTDGEIRDRDDLAPLIGRVVKGYCSGACDVGDRLSLSSGSGHTYAGSLVLVRDRLPFLSATDKEWIPSRTAARVLFHEH